MLANEQEQTKAVYSKITSTLEGQEVLELWNCLRSELTRKDGGPDASLEYLESELTRMEEQIQRAIEWLDEAKEE